MTGHWVCLVEHDRTRPIKEIHFWNLTGNDRTLEAQRLITYAAASGRLLTVEIKCSLLNIGDTWLSLGDRTLRSSVRSVGPERPVSPCYAQ